MILSVGFGGDTTNQVCCLASLKDVCTDRTGHAEVLQVEYDPTQVSYEQLLDVFWINHDPTTPISAIEPTLPRYGRCLLQPPHRRASISSISPAVILDLSSRSGILGFTERTRGKRGAYRRRPIRHTNPWMWANAHLLSRHGCRFRKVAAGLANRSCTERPRLAFSISSAIRKGRWVSRHFLASSPPVHGGSPVEVLPSLGTGAIIEAAGQPRVRADTPGSTAGSIGNMGSR